MAILILKSPHLTFVTGETPTLFLLEYGWELKDEMTAILCCVC